MAPFSEQVPKPFFCIDGKPLIQHTIDYAKMSFPGVPVLVSAQSKHLRWFEDVKFLDQIIINNSGSNYAPILQLNGRYAVFCSDLLLKMDVNWKELFKQWVEAGTAAAVFPIPHYANDTRKGDQLTKFHIEGTQLTKFHEWRQFTDHGQEILCGISFIDTNHKSVEGIHYGGFGEFWRMANQAQDVSFFPISRDGWYTFDTIREIADYEGSRPSFTRDVKEVMDRIRQAHQIEEGGPLEDPGPI